MSENVAHTGAVGGERVGLRPVVQVHGTSHTAIQFTEMGHNAPNGTDPWGLPPQGGLLDDGLKAAVKSWGGGVLQNNGEGYA